MCKVLVLWFKWAPDIRIANNITGNFERDGDSQICVVPSKNCIQYKKILWVVWWCYSFKDSSWDVGTGRRLDTTRVLR